MKEIKEFLKLIKELSKTSKGRKILFFCGYAIFFLILILVIRFSEEKPYKDVKYEKGSSYSIDFKNFDNFSYMYKIRLDNVLTECNGKKNDIQELFEVNGNSYYREDDKYFINKSDLWLKSDNPLEFSYFLELNNINKIIDNATFISKTEYESGKVSYNFEISSNTLNYMISDINTDFDDKPNNIIVNIDENRNINEIKFDLDSYCVNSNQCTNSLDIELYYDSIDEIEEIKSPIK